MLISLKQVLIGVVFVCFALSKQTKLGQRFMGSDGPSYPISRTGRVVSFGVGLIVLWKGSLPIIRKLLLK
jgi:hypothetical protein